jgi:hypothetical protein
MYYVMEMDTRLTAKFIYFRNEPAGFKGSLWRTGERLKAPPAQMTLIAEDEKPTALSDMLLTSADLHVYSPKLMGTLGSAGVSNMEYFPIIVVDKKRGVTRDDYRVANIVGNVACLDVANSSVDTFEDGKGYRSVEEFSLLEDRIRPLPGMKNPPLIFRLAEFQYHVIAHESLKAACERDGITGVRFVRTQDFG